jgi:hypothetical protein
MSYYNPYVNFAQNQLQDQYDPQGSIERVRQIRLAQEQARQQPSQSSNPYGKLIASTGMGVAQGAGTSNNSYNQNIGTTLQGAASGFATAGVPGAIVGAIGSVVGQELKINKNINNLNTGVNGVTDVDSFGRPLYNGQPLIDARNKYNSLAKATGPEEGSFWLKGKGNPLTLNKRRRKLKEISNGIDSAQQSYNDSATQFNNNQLANTQYNQLMNNQNRFKNLYNIGTSLY